MKLYDKIQIKRLPNNSGHGIEVSTSENPASGESSEKNITNSAKKVNKISESVKRKQCDKGTGLLSPRLCVVFYICPWKSVTQTIEIAILGLII